MKTRIESDPIRPDQSQAVEKLLHLALDALRGPFAYCGMFQRQITAKPSEVVLHAANLTAVDPCRKRAAIFLKGRVCKVSWPAICTQVQFPRSYGDAYALVPPLPSLLGDEEEQMSRLSLGESHHAGAADLLLSPRSCQSDEDEHCTSNLFVQAQQMGKGFVIDGN